MVYSAEEKARMDALMETFGDYLASSREMDVAYSEKTGFVRLIIAEEADAVYFPIKDHEDMLQTFFFDILMDEIDQALEQDPGLTNQTMDYSVPHDRLRAIVNTMPTGRDHALSQLDAFIGRNKQAPRLP